VADLRQTVAWANENDLRWAFTLSSAATLHFEDRSNLDQLDEIDWNAVSAHYWSNVRDQKQAEFLIERNFPWHLIEEVAVYNRAIGQQAMQSFAGIEHRPPVHIRQAWYY
jgi:hypothetical protein